MPVRGAAKRIAATPEQLAACALVCLYAALMSGHLYSIDGLLMYRQALALLYAHSIHLSPPIVCGSAIRDSKYGVGLSLLYLPGSAVLWWLSGRVPQSGSNPYNWSMFYNDPVYSLSGAPVQLGIAALSAYLVARLIRELGFGVKTALWALTLYGVASPAAVYAKADWAQPLVGLCWIGALYSSMRWASIGKRVHLWMTMLYVGYAVVTRPVEGSVLLPAVLIVIVHERHLPLRPWSSLPGVAPVVGAYLLGLAITLALNWARYGSPFRTGYGGEGWSAPLGVTIPAALVSPTWGILWEFPSIVLIPLGMLALHRRGHTWMGAILSGLIALQFLNTAAWHDWAGGWNWGLRLFVPALPLCAVLAAAGASSLPPALRRWVPQVLFIGGVMWVIPCVMTDLLAGYAGMVSGAPIYDFRDYPLLAAWQFVHSWRELDILWIRQIANTGYVSLVPLLGLLALAAVLAFKSRRLANDLAGK